MHVIKYISVYLCVYKYVCVYRHMHVYLYMYVCLCMYIYMVHSMSFQTFFVQAFKIVVDS